VLAKLPCTTPVCEAHAYVGFVIVGGWFLLFLFGLGGFITRHEPNQWFWRLLAVLQALLGIQLVAGVILLAAGHRPDTWRHYVYGVIGPAVVLVIAHVLGRGMDDEAATWKVFAWASFFIFGLTFMALATGLEII
jgi:hypothetical protein